MPDVNDNLRDSMLQQARLALRADANTADQAYNQLLEKLESTFGNNHKEIAAELQQIAKTIEEGGDLESAFTFKQRTCEIMLRRNMEQRRKNRPPQSSAITVQLPAVKPPAMPTTKLFGPMEYVCMPCEDISATVEFYAKALHAERIVDGSEKDPPFAVVKVAPGPSLLLIQQAALKHCQPVFAVDDAAKVLRELKKECIDPVGDPIETALGPLFCFCDHWENRFAIVGRKRNR